MRTNPSLACLAPIVLAGCSIPPGTVQVPFAFAVPVSSGNVPGDGKISVSATISDRGRLAWMTPAPVPFTLGRGDSDVGTIMLTAVARDPADPER